MLNFLAFGLRGRYNTDRPVTASIQPSGTRAWLEIDLAALVANARTLSAAAGVPLLPMVKANGYGLGAVACARALEQVDPWGFGVATLPEAEELRAAGITRSIIVFTPWVPAVASHESPLPGVRCVIGDVESLAAWLTASSAPQRPGAPVPFHLEIDTGMARAGIRFDDHAALARAAELLASAKGWEGVFTHFHSGDSSAEATALQWARFQQALGRLGRRPPMVHAANSGGTLRSREYAGAMVRPGIFLYGGELGGWAPAPRPVATLKARVVALRTIGAGEGVSYAETWRADAPTEIATVACGYADGILRSGSNTLRVELNGAIVPVVGRVTMDMTMVAVPRGTAKVGDVATLFGGKVSLAEHAAGMGTNVYEALTAIGARIPRIYR